MDIANLINVVLLRPNQEIKHHFLIDANKSGLVKDL